MPSYHILISSGCGESRHIPACQELAQQSWSDGMGRAFSGSAKERRLQIHLGEHSWRAAARPFGSASRIPPGLEPEALLCWIRLLCWIFVSVHHPDSALCLISWRLGQHRPEPCSCQQDMPRGAWPCQGVCVSMGLPLLSTSRDRCS